MEEDEGAEASVGEAHSSVSPCAVEVNALCTFGYLGSPTPLSADEDGGSGFAFAYEGYIDGRLVGRLVLLDSELRQTATLVGHDT